jgi:hypothetical protein
MRESNRGADVVLQVHLTSDSMALVLTEPDNETVGEVEEVAGLGA